MHQPNLQPNPSSYFDYKIHPFLRPPEMNTSVSTPTHPAVVVGAGPIGLVLAILLARQGVKTVLIESEAQVCGGSRALALSRRSMEIMEQAGVDRAFLSEAILWDKGRSYYRGQVVHHLDLPFSEDDKYAPMTNLPQCNMEGILVEHALALGVDVRFQTRLIGLDEQSECVLLTLDTPEGEYRTRAQWVVGCDGARSAVRRLQGLRFEGNSFESRFVIADFKIDIDAPAGRRCYFDPPWLPGHSALLHKAPFGVWRLDYQVPADVNDEEALDPARIQAHIQAHLDYIGVSAPWKIEWTTLYKPNTLTLASYRHGRVMYCGDAAHLLPVFGVRGMNTGVQDSINLAWKLAAVIHGKAENTLLDTYSSERVADARQICSEAARSTRMMAPPTRGYSILQQAVLDLCLRHEFPRELLHWRTSRPIDYADSVLTLRDTTESWFTAGPTPGAPARNVKLDDGRFLLDSFSYEFQILVFAGTAALQEQALQMRDHLRSKGPGARLITVGSARESAAGADVELQDAKLHAARLWGAEGGAIYILRPDQHILTRWKPGGGMSADILLQALLAAHAPQARNPSASEKATT